ncbi:hypothetical protein V6N12_055730 [Hibiscus sabdariffa]|uniref:Uncharacterized protein n=1 Tax=Hibiscus sabdariffa TaxID=183260 RepID=A0ABR2AW48_9ROSI
MPMEWRNGGGQCNGFLLCRGRYRKCFEFIPSYVRALFPLNNHLPIKLKLEVGTVSFFYIRCHPDRQQPLKSWPDLQQGRPFNKCIAWSFLGFHQAQQFTSPDQERSTPSNKISQMCSASCQASSWLLEKLSDSR